MQFSFDINSNKIAAKVLGLPSLTLLSADTDLNDAAIAEDLTVDNPNNH